MAPKRKLVLKSIWDESLVRDVLPNPHHRARMWQWLVNHPDKDVCDVPFDSWSTAKKPAQILIEQFKLLTCKIVEQNDSARGDTHKLLLELQDGHRIETVIMKHAAHATVCVSSQIGCQMGCRFCATGTMGIIGNLTSGEIMEQLVYANQLLHSLRSDSTQTAAGLAKIRNVVFMGMGEPLNNYDNLKLAVEFMVDDRRFGLSPKHVTVSTVGVLKSMQRLSDDLPAVMLAVSLHAPNQEVRMKIVPAASAHKIDKIMAAIDLHIERNKEAWSKKREAARGYILIKGVNDLEEHAHELGQLLAPRRDHILLNLIPYNPTEVAEDYEPPTEESVRRFFDICISEPYVIHTRVRQEMGQDVAAACGQLALVSKKQDSAPRDIEDYGSRTRTKQTKTKIRERNPPSPDVASHISRANMLCYVSVALPLAVVSILELIRPAQ
ncbi:hypothetical protein B484DRAFT_327158 [Ochromonadaceae sp. CCMP2298]|nr:hypothetical protein B484DRAFT_327158 [Ochromonadaceae sp. CCMP2298]